MHRLRLLLAGAALSMVTVVAFAPHAMAQEEEHDPVHTVEEEAPRFKTTRTTISCCFITRWPSSSR